MSRKRTDPNEARLADMESFIEGARLHLLRNAEERVALEGIIAGYETLITLTLERIAASRPPCCCIAENVTGATCVPGDCPRHGEALSAPDGGPSASPRTNDAPAVAVDVPPSGAWLAPVSGPPATPEPPRE